MRRFPLPRPLFKVLGIQWRWAHRTLLLRLRILHSSPKAVSTLVCGIYLPRNPYVVLMAPMFPGYPALLSTDAKQGAPYTYTSQAGPYDLSSQQMIVGPSSTNSPPPTQPDFFSQPPASGSNFGGLGFGQFPHMMTCPLKPVHLVGPVTYSASSV
jgi:hypothetical protein